MSGVKHTPRPWRLVIDDTGGQWSGWPLCVCPVSDDDRTIVRTGGMWPYEWDAATSQREAVANARLIAAAPDLLEAGQNVVEEWGMRTGDDDALLPSSEQPESIAALMRALARARGEQSPNHSDKKEVGNG